MRSLNMALLLGNMGKDPDLSYTPSGTAMAKFSLATSESWKDANGEKAEKTEWHNIVVWGKRAENIHQYVKKGARLFILGRIQTRSYDDKNTGTKKYITEIVANDVIYLDKRADDGETTAQSMVGVAAAAVQAAVAGDGGGDLPF